MNRKQTSKFISDAKKAIQLNEEFEDGYYLHKVSTKRNKVYLSKINKGDEMLRRISCFLGAIGEEKLHHFIFGTNIYSTSCFGSWKSYRWPLEGNSEEEAIKRLKIKVKEFVNRKVSND